MAGTDIAELGLAIRSDGVDVASDRLRRMRREAGHTEKAAINLTGAFKRLATVAGGALAAAFSVKAMFAYQSALAEVSTLVDTSTFSMKALSDAALDQAVSFGNVQGQVKAYYQIISAGAGSVAEATDILTASNKLAVGGVTDIATAADGLTSVLNAYGNKVESATAVSDALFTGMRAGKTTIGELSAGLGKVAPLAAQTGVGFDELVGSISALTKGGISTNEAITGVRAVLAAVAKPTSEATKLASALGLEFNSTALEAKGLAGFLDSLILKTGGSTDALAQLFGGVEALVPVMALSGQAGKDFTAIMEDMAVKAGATEEAFAKMAASPGFQLERLFGAMQVEALGLMNTIGGGLVPAIKFLADNFDRAAEYATSFAIFIGGPYVAAFIAARVATFTLVGALTTLRAILIRTGIGLLAVAVGELIYQFTRLVEKTGSVGAAFAEMGNIGNEVMYAMSMASESVADKIEASFLNAFASIQDGFAETLKGFGMGGQASMLSGLADSNRTRASGLNEAADIGFGIVGDTLNEVLSSLSDSPMTAANDNLSNEVIRLEEILGQGSSAWDKYKLSAANANEAVTLDSSLMVGKVGDILGSLGSIMESAGGEQFEIAKGLSLAMAVLKGYEAVTSAYAAGAAIPGGGPITGALYAAAAGAASIANIAQIASTSKNSTSMSGAGVSATPSTQTAASTTPTRTTNVHLQPSALYTAEQLAELLNEYTADGGKINVYTKAA